MNRRSSLLFTGLIALAMLLPVREAAAQNKPVLTFPTNGYNLVSPSANTFSWYYITTNLNVSYTLEIYLNPGCTGTPVASETIAGPSTYKNNVSGLMGGITYYWRVRAGGTSQPSPWSDVFEFKTTGNPPLNIFAKAGDNGSISPSGTIFPASGSSQTYLITPNTGCYIKDVLIDNVSAGALSYYTFRNITESHSITAQFAPKTFTMTAAASANGTVSPAGTTSAAYNSTVTYRFTPAPGYRVSGLIVDGVQIQPASSYTFSNIKSDHTIDVTFGQGYVISTTVKGGGSVNPASDYYTAAANSNQTFTFTPFSGFRVAEVKVDGIPVPAAASDSLGLATAYTFTNLAADHSLSVSFTNEFPVTVVTGAHGKAQPSGITNAPAGSVVKIYITPDKGYGVSSITVNGTPVPKTNPLVITVDRPYTVNVTFFQSKNYYVAVNGDDSNPGTKELPMKTIYWAIQRAAEGDSVIIENGFYNELFSSKPFVKVRGSGETYVNYFQVNCDNIYLSNIKFNQNLSFITSGGISNNPNAPGYSNINLDHISLNAVKNYGLELTNCSNINISNSEFLNSGNFSAIRLTGCTDVTLTDVSAGSSSRGIVVEPSSAFVSRNISFTRVKAYKNGIDSAGTSYTALPGIFLRGVSGGSFKDVTASKNGTGISILGCVNLTFENLTVDSSAYDGILTTVYDPGRLYPYVSSINLSFSGLNRLRMNNGNAFRFDTYGGLFYSVIKDVNFSGRTEISQFTDSLHTVSGIDGVAVPYANNGHAAVLLSGGVYNVFLSGLDLYTAGSNREAAIVIGDISDSMRVVGARINNSFFRYESGISLAGPRGAALNNVDARNNVFMFPSAETQGISSLMTDRAQTQNPNMGIINYTPYTTGYAPGISLKLGSGGPGIFIGGTYSFDVNLNPKAASFYFIKCTLTWNPSKLEYKGYISNGLINDAQWNLRITENSSGSLTFECLGTTPVSSIGKLFTLQMKVINQQAGTDSITAAINEYWGLNTIGGFAGSTLAFYANFPPGPVQDKGDVSLDRVVNSWDYYLLLYHISGLYPLTSPEALANADFNGDGLIDNSDLIFLYSFINGINPVPAPAQGSGSIAFSGARLASDSSAVIPVGIRNAAGVRTLGITLNYDPLLISYQAFSSSLTSGKNTVHAFEIKPGVAKFIVQSADDMAGNINPGSIILHLSGSKIPAGAAVQTTFSINGGPENAGPDLLLKNSGITSAGSDKSLLPSEFALSQNYPNPFNPSTTISYSVPEVSFVALRIYNLMGQEVRNLISEEKSPGRYYVKWNGENNAGERVASGIYLYRFTAGSHSETRKMNLLK